MTSAWLGCGLCPRAFRDQTQLIRHRTVDHSRSMIPINPDPGSPSRSITTTTATATIGVRSIREGEEPRSSRSIIQLRDVRVLLRRFDQHWNNTSSQDESQGFEHSPGLKLIFTDIPVSRSNLVKLRQDSVAGSEGSSDEEGSMEKSARLTRKRKARESDADDYSCPHCPEIFEDASTLQEHIRVHFGKSSFPCGECGLSLPTLIDLKKHKRTHSTDKSWHPTSQNSTSRPIRPLNSRQNRGKKTNSKLKKPGSKPDLIKLRCEYCARTFKNRGGLRLHEKSHVRRGDNKNVPGRKKNCTIPCDACGEMFYNKHNLARHKIEVCRVQEHDSHEGTVEPVLNVYSDPACFEFENMNGEDWVDPNSPKKTVSPQLPKKAGIDLNTNSAPAEGNLRAPVNKFNVNTKCQYCFKLIPKRDYPNHLDMHRRARPFFCKADGCSQAYSDAIGLTRHNLRCPFQKEELLKSRQHTEENILSSYLERSSVAESSNNFSCKTCGFKARHRDALESHQLIHINAQNRRRQMGGSLSISSDKEDDSNEAKGMPVLRSETEGEMASSEDHRGSDLSKVGGSPDRMPILSPQVGLSPGTRSRQQFSKVMAANMKARMDQRAQTQAGKNSAYKHCPICRKLFLTRNLSRHVRVHTGERPYACDVCLQNWTDNRQRQRHKCPGFPVGQTESTSRSHSNDLPVDSPAQTFSPQIVQVQGSYRGVHVECESCGMDFDDMAKYESHICEENGIGALVIDDAGAGDSPYEAQYVLTSTVEVEDDVPNAHDQDRPTRIIASTARPCPHCKHMISARHMTRHIRLHTGEQPYACQNCGKTFIDRRAQKTHMAKCTDERLKFGSNPKFTCIWCDRSFFNTQLGQIHQSTCQKKQIQSQEAPQVPGPQEDDDIEIIEVELEAPYEFHCSYCQMPFDRLQTKLAHERSHSDVTMVCKICRTHLANKEYLAKHYRLLHPGHKFHFESDLDESSISFSLPENTEHLGQVPVDSTNAAYNELGEESLSMSENGIVTSTPPIAEHVEINTGVSPRREVSSPELIILDNTGDNDEVPQFPQTLGWNEVPVSFLPIYNHQSQPRPTFRLPNRGQASRNLSTIRVRPNSPTIAKISLGPSTAPTQENNNAVHSTLPVQLDIAIQSNHIISSSVQPGRSDSAPALPKPANELANRSFVEENTNTQQEMMAKNSTSTSTGQEVPNKTKQPGRPQPPPINPGVFPMFIIRANNPNPSNAIVAEKAGSNSSRSESQGQAGKESNLSDKITTANSQPPSVRTMPALINTTIERIFNEDSSQRPTTSKTRLEVERRVTPNIHIDTGRLVSKPKVICPHCKIPVLKHLMTDHIKEHAKDMPYPCNLCSQKFFDRRRYLTHMTAMHPNAHSADTDFPVTATSADQQIISPVSRKNPLECAICHQTFSQARNRRKHEEKTHGYIEASCETCGGLFESQEMLRLHEKVHLQASGNFFNCKFCPASFSQRASLTKHGQMVHAEHYNYKIPGHGEPEPSPTRTTQLPNQTQPTISLPQWTMANITVEPTEEREEEEVAEDPFGDVSTNDNALTVNPFDPHDGLNHNFVEESTVMIPLTADGAFLCHYCQKAFATKSKLRKHLHRMHTGERIFKCPEIGCDKAYVDRKQLDNHVRTHTGELPFPCEQCDKRFSSQTNLGRHRRLHLPPEAVLASAKRCTQCDRRFKNSSELKLHIRATHTGERPCTCTFCGANFARPANLSQHMKTHMRKAAAASAAGFSAESSDSFEPDAMEVDEEEVEDQTGYVQNYESVPVRQQYATAAKQLIIEEDMILD